MRVNLYQDWSQFTFQFSAFKKVKFLPYSDIQKLSAREGSHIQSISQKNKINAPSLANKL